MNIRSFSTISEKFDCKKNNHEEEEDSTTGGSRDWNECRDRCVELLEDIKKCKANMNEKAVKDAFENYIPMMRKKEQASLCNYFTRRVLLPYLSLNTNTDKIEDWSSLIEALEETSSSWLGWTTENTSTCTSMLTRITPNLSSSLSIIIWYPTPLLLHVLSLLISPTSKYSTMDEEAEMYHLLHWLGSRHGIILSPFEKKDAMKLAVDKYRQALLDYSSLHPASLESLLALSHLAMDTNSVHWILELQDKNLLVNLLYHKNMSNSITNLWIQQLIYKYHTSRHYADAPTLIQTLQLLTQTLQQIVQTLRPEHSTDTHNNENTKQNETGKDRNQEQNNKKQKKTHIILPSTIHPIVISNLIDIITSLFYFLLYQEEEELELIQQVYDSIEILYLGATNDHPSILKSCANFFSLAFAYHPQNQNGQLITSTKQFAHLENSNHHLELQSKVNLSFMHKLSFVLSRKSLNYAKATCQYFIEASKSSISIHTLLSTLLLATLAEPRITQSYWNDDIYPCFQSFIQKKQSNSSINSDSTFTKYLYQMILIELSSHINYSALKENHVTTTTTTLLTKNSWIQFQTNNKEDSWYWYKIATHAYTMNHYHITQNLLSSYILPLTSTKTSFIWLSGLQCTSHAEHLLQQGGLSSIPQSLVEFQKALTRFQQLLPSTQFQCEFVQCRIELFHLILMACEQCRSIQLINKHQQQTSAISSSNKKNLYSLKKTRTLLHQRNIPHAILMICNKYATLYKRYGLLHCQQTRTSLRTLHAMCHFIAELLSKVVFQDACADSPILLKHFSPTKLWPKGDKKHPMMTLIQKLREKVLSEFLSSSSEVNIEPRLRATTVLEILQLILTKAPCPSPRGFTLVRSLPCCKNLRLVPSLSSTLEYQQQNSKEDHHHNKMDSEVVDYCFDADDDHTANVLETATGETCTIHAIGTIPSSYRKYARIPFYQVLISYSITYDGPIDVNNDEDEEEDVDEDKAAGNNYFSASESTSNVGSLYPGGRFHIPIEFAPIHQEGFYQLHVKLGCRDIRCGEWEIPLSKENDGIILLCVTSSS